MEAHGNFKSNLYCHLWGLFQPVYGSVELVSNHDESEITVTFTYNGFYRSGQVDSVVLTKRQIGSWVGVMASGSHLTINEALNPKNYNTKNRTFYYSTFDPSDKGIIEVVMN